jgi:hypothetical protein
VRVLRFAARALALEGRTFFCGVEYLTGRLRVRPAGFSYDRDQIAVYWLYAMPAFIIPEAIAFDLLLAHWPAVRYASDGLHLYLLVWGYGILGALRRAPHRVEAGRAELRLGPFMHVSLPLDAIERAGVCAAAFDRTALRALRGEAGVLALPQAGRLVEIALRRPVVLERAPFEARTVSRLFVMADRPHELAAALTQP